MNLRVIKKDVEFFVGEFIEDCTLFVVLNQDKNVDGINGILSKSVDLYNDLKDKINNVPEEIAPKPQPKDKNKDKPKARKFKAVLKTRKDKDAQTKKLNVYYDGIRKELFEKLDELSEELSGIVSKATAE